MLVYLFYKSIKVVKYCKMCTCQSGILAEVGVDRGMTTEYNVDSAQRLETRGIMAKFILENATGHKT